MFAHDEFAEWMVAEGYARKTCACYANVLRVASRSIDLETVDARTLRRFAESLPFSRSSRSSLRSALTAYWRFCGREEGPGRAIRVPRKRTMRCRALSDAESAVTAIRYGAPAGSR